MPRSIKEDGSPRQFGYGKGGAFHYRASYADLSVIEEVLFRKIYDGISSVQEEMLAKRYGELLLSEELPLILDCGAHIGSSAVYFSDKYPAATIVAVEPENENYSFLEKNAEGRRNIVTVRGAITKDDGFVDLYDTQGGSWAFSLGADVGQSSLVGQVNAFSIESIVRKHGGSMQPFILKIDIEGGEGEIDFNALSDVLLKFQLIIIELHDWMIPWKGTSLPFLKFAASGDWDFLHQGENVFLYNRRLQGKVNDAR